MIKRLLKVPKTQHLAYGDCEVKATENDVQAFLNSDEDDDVFMETPKPTRIVSQKVSIKGEVCNSTLYCDEVLMETPEHILLANGAKPISSEIQKLLNLGIFDIVDFVIKKQVRKLTYDDKVLIKSLGRSCPVINNLFSSPNYEENVGTLYKNFDWLTGSPTRNQLFCWKCILFDDNHDNETIWVSQGDDDLEVLSSSLEKHQVTKDHIRAAVKFVLFGKQNIQRNIDSAHEDEIRKFNETVQVNREIMKRLIDMTIFLATHQGNAQKLAELLGLYDDQFKKVLNKSAFRDLPKTLQNDLINTINDVVKQRIESELKQAVCFSWQVDKCANIHHGAQCSIIVRYTSQGQVKERFLGFYVVANNLFKLLTDKFKHFNIEHKLIGQAYDGMAVKAADLDYLQTRIMSVAPQALFVHSQLHELNSVLQDMTSSIRECAVFFSCLQSIPALFSKTKRASLLERVRGQKMPDTADKTWRSKLISAILTDRDSFILVFEYMLRNVEFERDEEAIRGSSLLVDVLSDFDFLFLLNTFKFIFEQSDIASEIGRTKLVDTISTEVAIRNLLEILEEFRTEQHFFDEIFQSCTNILGPPTKKRKTYSGAADDSTTHFKSLFDDILVLITDQIRLRFGNVLKLQFYDLLDHTKFAEFQIKFPRHLLNNLVEAYPYLFNKDKLKNQLRVLYSEPEILGSVTDPSHMLKFIYNNSLETVLSEIYKFLSLVLSLPVTPASAEQSSVYKRMKSFFRNPMSQENLSFHSVIAIEKKFVEDLTKEATFYDSIIDRFADLKDHCFDLKYKAM